jgi:ABC-type transport system involved in multi-copper enzyme maturation permease subunit
MNKIMAIAGLTWKSAFRYRLFWILAVLLLAAVVGLPLVLKDDGTAKGLAQILLTYTLSAVATLLGVATLWLSCGTLAKDVEECQMQVVAVKPIARWQIWIGKWLGLLSLDATLLALAGAAIFSLLHWRASHLPAAEQKILHDEIFIARAGIKDQIPDLTKKIDALMNRRVKGRPTDYTADELVELRQQAKALVIAGETEVPPGYPKRWGIDLSTLRDHLGQRPLQLRVKFHTAKPNPDQRYETGWIVGPTNSSQRIGIEQNLPPDSFQEFEIPTLLDDKGILWIDFINPNDVAVAFPLEEGFELLYPESTFGINFVRGMGVLFCWLALLAAIGLAMASFLSFPVASFASLALLIMGLSSSVVSSVVEQGTITGYDAAKAGYGHSPVDLIIVPVFQGALKIIKLVESFSPIDDLSSGMSITWGELGLAVAQIILLLGGFFCVFGIILFTRRELATAQGNN